MEENENGSSVCSQRQVLQELLDTGFSGETDMAVFRERLSLDGDIWDGWLREGRLPGEVVRLSKGMAEMHAPWVWASLLKLTADGNVQAMKLYFELCKQDTAAVIAGVPDGEILQLRREIFDERAGEAQ